MPVTTFPPSLPLYFFVVSLVGYLFGRLVLLWIASGARKSKLGLRASSNASGERDATKAKELSDDERFELEKRAFFSKASLNPITV